MGFHDIPIVFRRTAAFWTLLQVHLPEALRFAVRGGPYGGAPGADGGVAGEQGAPGPGPPESARVSGRLRRGRRTGQGLVELV